jgi:predicted GNAT superfamily acetyltransferase
MFESIGLNLSFNYIESVLQIKLLRSLTEQDYAIKVFNTTWKTRNSTEITPNFLQALVHSGSYLAGAFIYNRCIGASLAFPASNGALHLHSHMTAVVEEFRDKSVGRALKIHQWHWAKKNNYPFISWTFDPLMSRNARFNINKLGTEILDYYPNFYGVMGDQINKGDETDRLMVSWKVADYPPTSRTSTMELGLNDILIPIPEDILKIREQDKEMGKKWRLQVRSQFLNLFHNGGSVVGFSEKNEYVVRM